jgi:hypothetical protein
MREVVARRVVEVVARRGVMNASYIATEAMSFLSASYNLQARQQAS